MSLITPQRAVDLVPQLTKLTPDRLAAHLDTASTTIESACCRKFAFATVTNESVRTDNYGVAWLERTPIVSGTLTLTDLKETAVNRWRLDTESGELNAPSFRDAFLLASYQGGYATIPPPIELAVASLARIDADRSASQASGEIASKQIGKVAVTYANISTMQAIPAIPKFVMDLIAPFMLPRLV